jgi:hypothetical protein
VATNVNSLLKDNFKACGLVKPGSNSISLLTTQGHDIDNLTTKDILLVPMILG